jgi:hypothetical protein
MTAFLFPVRLDRPDGLRCAQLKTASRQPKSGFKQKIILNKNQDLILNHGYYEELMNLTRGEIRVLVVINVKLICRLVHGGRYGVARRCAADSRQ